MSMAEELLAEFEQEAHTTRKFLERIPTGQLGWRPHERSMTAGQLALHIAASPGQVVEMATMDEVPVPDFTQPPPQAADIAEVMKAFDTSIEKVRNVLAKLDDAKMIAMWRALRDGKAVFAMPRAAFLRNILHNHLYHHRGQLSVYLRMMGVKVPSAYGPTADELPEFLQAA